MKNKKNKTQKDNVLIWIGLLVIGVFIGSLIPYGHYGMDEHDEMHDSEMSHMKSDMHSKIDNFISKREDLTKEQIKSGHYRCCLDKPCSHCLVEHGNCDCLDDIMNGKHPCGECIGEILEGHGNPLIAKYFATAIAEKTGQLDAIKQIISEKYGISIKEQI